MTGRPRKDDNVTSSSASLRSVKSGASSPSRTTRRSSSYRRAIGVVRVSRVGARSGETFVSPSEQRTRIEQACARDRLKLIDTLEELDVSGGAALEKRPGLRRAVDLVEAGEADVVVVAYLDRLVRSLAVQAEVVSRIEKAGGAILAVDVGAVSHGSSAQWLSASMLGAVSEYHRRVTAERTADAKRRAVERGVPPFPNVPPGYRRRDDGRLEPDGKKADAIRQAFEMRANGATVMEVRAYLKRRGIARSFHGTTSLLTSRIYLGELRFGDIFNPTSHKPLVDADTFGIVQRMKSPRGRRAKSERLLARLGVLRCATCGSKMVVGTANHGGYHLYRCPPIGDCSQRVTISAELAEQEVVEATRKLLKGRRGTARAGRAADHARRDLAKAEKALSGAIKALTGLEDVREARERLLELREARDRARDRVDELGAGAGQSLTITADDWDRLNLDEQRGLIRALIE